VLESTPPPQAASLGTIAELSRLSALTISSLADLDSTLASWLSGTVFREAVSTQSFAKARENLINYLNTVQYRVLPALATTGSKQLNEVLIKDAGDILVKLNTVIEYLRDQRFSSMFSPARRYGARDFAVANSEVLQNEAREFQKLRDQMLNLLRVVSKTNNPDYGDLPYDKIRGNEQLAREIAQAQMDVSLPESRDESAESSARRRQEDLEQDILDAIEMNEMEQNGSFYPSDFESDIDGAGRRRGYGESKYLPKTMFKEDTEFYAPEEESESESEEEEEQKGAAQPDLKVVYDGQGVAPKTYKVAGRRVITMPVPVFDPVGGQLTDAKAEESKIKKAEKDADKDDDGLRFKIGKRKQKR
jgi:hypothetical protein